MAHVIGDATPLIPAGLFGGSGADRQPLNAQVKAQLLAQMPFVSEAVGEDIADLGDATPAGSSRKTKRLALGAVLGLAAGAGLAGLYHRARRRR